MGQGYDPENPTAGGDYVAGGSPLTGRRVLFIFAAFVLTFVTVDLFMWRMASKTFGGLVTQESFRVGNQYGKEIEAARAQNERGWSVSEELSPIQDGKASLVVRVRDKDGREIVGLAGQAVFAHPADARRDVSVDLRERAPGEYVGSAELAPGAYNLQTDFTKSGERVFRSRNRIQLFGG